MSDDGETPSSSGELVNGTRSSSMVGAVGSPAPLSSDVGRVDDDMQLSTADGESNATASSRSSVGDTSDATTPSSGDNRAVDPTHASTAADGTAKPGRRRPPVPKKKQPGPYRVPPRERRHGLLIVNTGHGKGKTTAALGVLLRASGRDMRVGMFQFIKSAANPYGEHVAAARLGVEIIPLGDGFTWLSENIDEDRALARAGWERCRAALASGEYDVLILDEMTYALNYGWLDTAQVLAAIRNRPVGTHVIVTGRDASDALVEAADLVTEMRMVKHPYQEQGIGAQPGIEL